MFQAEYITSQAQLEELDIQKQLALAQWRSAPGEKGQQSYRLTSVR